jgi:hypothetical protein
MKYLNWNLSFINPRMILRMLLANGVVFTSEALPRDQLRLLSTKVSIKCGIYLEQVVVKYMTQFRDKKSSQIAAAIVY